MSGHQSNSSEKVPTIDLAHMLQWPSRYFIDGKPMTTVSLWVGCKEYEVRCSDVDIGNLKRITRAHCLCHACKDGTTHASDCAVHNEPAMPNGECNCGAIQRATT